MKEITSNLQLKLWIKQLQIKINKPRFFMLENRNPDFEISTKLKHIIIDQTPNEIQNSHNLIPMFIQMYLSYIYIYIYI
jgi:hypothetical protein